MSRPIATSAGAIILLVLQTGLGCVDTPKDRIDTGRRIELNVLAASSLTEAFEAIRRDFEAAHPQVHIKLTFAGSQVLRLQISQGAPVDVFASANEAHMHALVEDNHILQTRIFCRNELVVITPPDNPAGIERLSDLVRAQYIVIGSNHVPIGRYTRRMLERASTAYGPQFAADVRHRVVSHENNVRLVRAKVELGEADAAVVYRTDAAMSQRVRSIGIPTDFNARARYAIGLATRSAAPESADQFVAYVLSADGQRTLREFGFIVDEP